MGILSSVSQVVDGLGSIDEYGSPADVAGWIDTGSYAFNALVSGSIYKGFPSNKITVLAGEPSTGKTFYMIEALKGFLDVHPDNEGVIFDSEAAITSQMLRSHGIDTSRVGIIDVATIEEWRTKASKVLDHYAKMEKSKDFSEPRLFIALDSLGNLSTNKEVGDIQDGEDKRDMTKAGLVRGAFRVLTIKCGKTNTPMVITNHVYDGIGGNSNEKTASGGKGPMYSASTVIFLNKSKPDMYDPDAGVRIRAVTQKSRFTRERKHVYTLLDFNKGLNSYYGLLDLAEEGGVVEKVAGRYVIDGKKIYGKMINENPEKYWTQDLLDQLDKFVEKKFCFGNELDLIEEGGPPESDEKVPEGVAEE